MTKNWTTTLLICLSTFAFADNSLKTAAEEIMHAGAFLNQAGLCPATSGNISVRVSDDVIALTVSGKHKGELGPDDIMLVNLEGVPQNSSKKPSAETLLHTMIYNSCGDVGAILHTPSPNGTILTLLVEPDLYWSVQGYEIQKAFKGVTTHESTLQIPIFENSQDIRTLSQEIASYLKKNPKTYGFLIRGHGLYTWGQDMKEAKIRSEAFEYLFECDLTLRALKNLKK